jgi:hypothetical protein
MRALIVLLVLLFAVPSSASARVQEDLPWTFTQVFHSSIRLVRVDLGCTITERDADAGFLLFDYESSGRIHHGSIEFAVTNSRDGRETIRVVVQLPTLPTYVERMIVTRLERKLRDEVGPPPRAERRPPPEEAPPEEDEAEPAEPGESPST